MIIVSLCTKQTSEKVLDETKPDGTSAVADSFIFIVYSFFFLPVPYSDHRELLTE